MLTMFSLEDVLCGLFFPQTIDVETLGFVRLRVDNDFLSLRPGMSTGARRAVLPM
jgi:hypothetical protein